MFLLHWMKGKYTSYATAIKHIIFVGNVRRTAEMEQSRRWHARIIKSNFRVPLTGGDIVIVSKGIELCVSSSKKMLILPNDF